jgi:hypothetical protein
MVQQVYTHTRKHDQSELERVWNIVIDARDVGAEDTLNAAQRCRVEEAHGTEEDVMQRLAEQLA